MFAQNFSPSADYPHTTTPPTSPIRTVPYNEEAEQALLGAILVNNKVFEKVADLVKLEHFYVPVHGRIWDAISKLIERGQIASYITLKNYFRNDADLNKLYQDNNGDQYLADLAAGVVSTSNVDDYAQMVYDLYLRRTLIDIGENMAKNGFQFDLKKPPTEQIEDAEKKLYTLATTGQTRGGFVDFKSTLNVALSAIEEAFRRDSHVVGVTSGFRDIDAKMGGLHKSDLIILAGRPGMGKTALATNIAYRAAKAYLRSNGEEGAAVGFFSLEMSADQLAARILSEVAEVPSEKLRKGDLRDTEFRRLVEAANELSSIPFFIDDTPALSIGAVRTRARRLKRQHNLGLVVVDYLQLLQGTEARGMDNRVLEIGEISRGLKALAKELELPVIALSQLSRSVESREDKRPMLSDLRESGSIEQDADVVMFVFREPYYHERAEPKPRENEDNIKFQQRHESWMQRGNEIHNTAEVILAKQRHGPTGEIKLFFDGQFTRFDDLDSHHSGHDSHY